MRKYYGQQLEKLHVGLLDMAQLLEVAIKNALEALENGGEEPLVKAQTLEKEVNHMEKELEAFCMRLILRQQPVAKDLHLISAALKMITDMERIGDQAEDIAMLSEHLTCGKNEEILVNIRLMGVQTTQMLKQSITAYVDEDTELAKKIWHQDDIVDDLFIEVKNQVVEQIRSENASAQDAPDLLMIAKYFERIGDHIVNIAEWIVFAVTGEHLGEENA